MSLDMNTLAVIDVVLVYFCWLWTYFTLWFSVFIGDSEQVIARREYISITDATAIYVFYNIGNYIVLSNYQCFNYESNPSV